MATFSGTLLKINNQSVPGLKSYKVTYAKLWKDANRNMSGDVRATLIGIFPKLGLEFGGDLRQDDVTALIALLDNDYFGVTFFDPKSGGIKTAQYYSSDYDIQLVDKERGRYGVVSVDLIPVSRYS